MERHAFTLRIEKPLLERFKTLAKEERRTLTNMFNEMVSKYLQAKDVMKGIKKDLPKDTTVVASKGGMYRHTAYYPHKIGSFMLNNNIAPIDSECTDLFRKYFIDKMFELRISGRMACPQIWDFVELRNLLEEVRPEVEEHVKQYWEEITHA